jgi:hypothetical protein
MIWVEQAIPVYKLTPKLPEKKTEKKDVSFRALLHSKIGRLKNEVVNEKR